MPSYRSISNGKTYQLNKGAVIGQGAYGEVGEIRGRRNFVYKEISLTRQPGDWIITTRSLRLKSTSRELWALKKLNLLEGYIRENDKLSLLCARWQAATKKNRHQILIMILIKSISLLR